MVRMTHIFICLHKVKLVIEQILDARNASSLFDWEQITFPD